MSLRVEIPKRGNRLSPTPASYDSPLSTSKDDDSWSAPESPYNRLPSSAGSVNKKQKAAPKRWTAEEDKKLKTAVQQYGAKQWGMIAESVGSRNHIQCLQRWQRTLKPGLIKGQWTPEEDAKLVSLLEEGITKFTDVAMHIKGRTSKQCRERWFHHLDPHIKKGEFSPEDDEIILRIHKELGNCWAIISQALPGRTENAIKSRYKVLARAQGRTTSLGSSCEGLSPSKPSSSCDTPRSSTCSFPPSVIEKRTSYSARFEGSGEKLNDSSFSSSGDFSNSGGSCWFGRSQSSDAAAPTRKTSSSSSPVAILTEEKKLSRSITLRDSPTSLVQQTTSMYDSFEDYDNRTTNLHSSSAPQQQQQQEEPELTSISYAAATQQEQPSDLQLLRRWSEGDHACSSTSLAATRRQGLPHYSRQHHQEGGGGKHQQPEESHHHQSTPPMSPILGQSHSFSSYYPSTTTRTNVPHYASQQSAAAASHACSAMSSSPPPSPRRSQIPHDIATARSSSPSLDDRSRTINSRPHSHHHHHLLLHNHQQQQQQQQPPSPLSSFKSSWSGNSSKQEVHNMNTGSRQQQQQHAEHHLRPAASTAGIAPLILRNYGGMRERRKADSAATAAACSVGGRISRQYASSSLSPNYQSSFVQDEPLPAAAAAADSCYWRQNQNPQQQQQPRISLSSSSWSTSGGSTTGGGGRHMSVRDLAIMHYHNDTSNSLVPTSPATPLACYSSSYDSEAAAAAATGAGASTPVLAAASSSLNTSMKDYAFDSFALEKQQGPIIKQEEESSSLAEQQSMDWSESSSYQQQQQQQHTSPSWVERKEGEESSMGSVCSSATGEGVGYQQQYRRGSAGCSISTAEGVGYPQQQQLQRYEGKMLSNMIPISSISSSMKQHDYGRSSREEETFHFSHHKQSAAPVPAVNHPFAMEEDGVVGQEVSYFGRMVGRRVVVKEEAFDEAEVAEGGDEGDDEGEEEEEEGGGEEAGDGQWSSWFYRPLQVQQQQQQQHLQLQQQQQQQQQRPKVASDEVDVDGFISSIDENKNLFMNGFRTDDLDVLAASEEVDGGNGEHQHHLHHGSCCGNSHSNDGGAALGEGPSTESLTLTSLMDCFDDEPSWGH